MLTTRHAAFPGLLIVLSLAPSCGGRSSLTENVPGEGMTSSCPEPDSAVPDTGSLMLGPGPYETFQVTLQNHCTETIWPAWGATGGLDQTVPDPGLWAPLSPGASNTVTFHYIVTLEIALWGRTRCSFDEAGKGACETGNCGDFVCPGAAYEAPNDATLYDFSYGFGEGYNVPMRVTTPDCEDRQCSFDLAECSDASRVVGACGVAGCRQVCPSASECCHPYSNGCFAGGDVALTFCP